MRTVYSTPSGTWEDHVICGGRGCIWHAPKLLTFTTTANECSGIGVRLEHQASKQLFEQPLKYHLHSASPAHSDNKGTPDLDTNELSWHE